jgi:hypothetical protein
MHFDWHFTAIQVLWTLTFAAQLILIVVLLGRDRARIFPWFTASIVAMALRLLCGRELFQRVPQLTLTSVLIAFSDVVAVLGLLVIVELARRAFVGAHRPQVLINVAGLLLVTASILWMWGPWPSWQTLTADSQVANLRIFQLIAQKTELLVDLLNIELGLMIVIFGRHFNAPWKSHTQRIAIGLSTASISGLTVQTVWQYIAKTAAPHTQAELTKTLDLRDRLFNASGALYIAVLVWWIVSLWLNEPDSTAPVTSEAPAPQQVLALSDDVQDKEQ